MNIKAMIEKKNELLAEYRSLIEQAKVEKRDLKGDAREAELFAEIADLNAKIKAEENRAAKEADSIENINSKEEKREMENKITKEMEVRGLEQFFRKQFDGEEYRSLVATSSPAGGQTSGAVTVPQNLSNYIVSQLFEVAPLFARAKQFTPVSGTLDILKESNINAGSSAVGFVGEFTDLSKADVTMAKVTLSQKRVGTAIELSQQLINDSGIDIVNYATNVLSRRLGVTLDRTVINGTKADKFEGLQGNINISEVTAASATAIAIDELLALYTAMNPEYVGGAVFVMNRSTFNMIAKLKDANGQYYLVRDVATTGPIYKLFGQPVLINDAVDNHAAGARSVLFVNMEEAYATMVKKGLNFQHVSGDTTQALRGSVMIMLDGYMDGKIINENAAKWLRVTGTPVAYPA